MPFIMFFFHEHPCSFFLSYYAPISQRCTHSHALSFFAVFFSFVNLGVNRVVEWGARYAVSRVRDTQQEQV